MKWLTKAPTAVIVLFGILATVLAIAVLVVYAYLATQGDPSDLADFRQWVQTIGIALAVPLLGVNTVATWAGGRSASNAEDNTNGINSSLRDENLQLRAQLERLGLPSTPAATPAGQQDQQ